MPRSCSTGWPAFSWTRSGGSESSRSWGVCVSRLGSFAPRPTSLGTQAASLCGHRSLGTTRTGETAVRSASNGTAIPFALVTYPVGRGSGDPRAPRKGRLLSRSAARPWAPPPRATARSLQRTAPGTGTQSMRQCAALRRTPRKTNPLRARRRQRRRWPASRTPVRLSSSCYAHAARREIAGFRPGFWPAGPVTTSYTFWRFVLSATYLNSVRRKRRHAAPS